MPASTASSFLCFELPLRGVPAAVLSRRQAGLPAEHTDEVALGAERQEAGNFGAVVIGIAEHSLRRPDTPLPDIGGDRFAGLLFE